MEIVKERKIPVPYTIDDLDRDLEYAMRRKSGER